MTSPVDEKRAKALELHLAGATYDSIAQAVGYASKSGAHKAVQEALDDLGNYASDDVIETELARLDAMLTGLWPKARRGDVQAVDRVLKIGERRSSLMAMSSRGEIEEAENPLDELASRRRTAGRPDASGVAGSKASGK